MIKLLTGVVIIFVCLIALFTFWPLKNSETLPNPATPTIFPSPTPTQTPIEILKSQSVVNTDVPFILQAPLQEWSDPSQQDACEEASILMAVKWARNEPAGTPEEQRAEILEISDWERQNFGEARDTSAADSINRIAKGYFNFEGATLKENITSDDIIRELHQGNLVITPMNGQAMNNPHFTPPGPERHMVLIIGYDADTQEFITNDTGITPGKDYRYPVGLFFNAIRDYETGYHLPIQGDKKNMIVVSKQ